MPPAPTEETNALTMSVHTALVVILAAVPPTHADAHLVGTLLRAMLAQIAEEYRCDAAGTLGAYLPSSQSRQHNCQGGFGVDTSCGCQGGEGSTFSSHVHTITDNVDDDDLADLSSPITPSHHLSSVVAEYHIAEALPNPSSTEGTVGPLPTRSCSPTRTAIAGQFSPSSYLTQPPLFSSDTLPGSSSLTALSAPRIPRRRSPIAIAHIAPATPMRSPGLPVSMPAPRDNNEETLNGRAPVAGHPTERGHNGIRRKPVPYPHW